MRVRPAGPGDADAICSLVDADRLPGQPPCTPERAQMALSGRGTADEWWWDQLAGHVVLGVEGADGRLVGAGAVGRRADGRRFLIWAHTREDRAVTDRLLAELLRGVGRAAPVEAFVVATELGVGLEGLPRAARPVTHDALVARGFIGADRWLYLRAATPGPPPAAPVVTAGDEHGLHLELRSPSGEALGDAEVAVAAPGVGILWWLGVEPRHQRQGHGREILRSARHALAAWGAEQTILVVDHDDPAARDRRPAVALYLSEGYEVVDHLWQYRRGAAVAGA